MHDLDIQEYRNRKLQELQGLREAVENSSRGYQRDAEYYERKTREYWALYKAESKEFIEYIDKRIQEQEGDKNEILNEGIRFATEFVFDVKRLDYRKYLDHGETCRLDKAKVLLKRLQTWVEEIQGLENSDEWDKYFVLIGEEPCKKFGATKTQLLNFLDNAYRFIGLTGLTSEIAKCYEESLLVNSDNREDMLNLFNRHTTGLANMRKAQLELRGGLGID